MVQLGLRLCDGGFHSVHGCIEIANGSDDAHGCECQRVVPGDDQIQFAGGALQRRQCSSLVGLIEREDGIPRLAERRLGIRQQFRASLGLYLADLRLNLRFH